MEASGTVGFDNIDADFRRAGGERHMDEFSDSRLVELAQAGNEDAFLELAGRHFGALYDFAVRLLGDADESEEAAAEALRETLFILTRGAEGIVGPDVPTFRASLFSAARSARAGAARASAGVAAVRLRKRGGVRRSRRERLDGAVDAAEAAEVAPMVWEAAQALDARQLSLLDLELRQGLDRDELAAVAGVTPENCEVLLNRLHSTADDALAAFILAEHGQPECDELATALAAVAARPVSVAGGPDPGVRRVVDQHLERCSACAERRARLASPLDVFAAFAPVAIPAGVQARVLGALADAWPVVDATVGARPIFANSRTDLTAFPGGRGVGRPASAIGRRRASGHAGDSRVRRPGRGRGRDAGIARAAREPNRTDAVAGRACDIEIRHGGKRRKYCRRRHGGPDRLRDRAGDPNRHTDSHTHTGSQRVGWRGDFEHVLGASRGGEPGRRALDGHANAGALDGNADDRDPAHGHAHSAANDRAAHTDVGRDSVHGHAYDESHR